MTTFQKKRVENVVTCAVACPNRTVGRKLGNGLAASLQSFYWPWKPCRMAEYVPEKIATGVY